MWVNNDKFNILTRKGYFAETLGLYLPVSRGRIELYDFLPYAEKPDLRFILKEATGYTLAL